MEVTKHIPKEHFNLWYGIFKQSNGHFLFDPIENGDTVFVGYSFKEVEDANRLNHSFYALTMPIVETKRSFWKRIKVRLGL